MKRLLPKVPHLDHFKNEAKALAKAHRDGDVSVCATLRQLRRFESAADEAILAAHVKLTEMQFALAQDYGYPSWAALRAIIPPQLPKDFAPDAKPGALLLSDVPAGGTGPDRVSAALAMLLGHTGAMVDHITVAGDLGLAFVLQADALTKPYGADVPNLDMGWWPLAEWGYEHRLPFLGKAHGITFEHLHCPADDWKNGPDKFFHKNWQAPLRACLEAGRPAVGIGRDINLIVGVDSGEPPLLGQLACEKEVRVQRMGEYPYQLLLPVGTRKPMDRLAVDREALLYAIRLGRDEEDLSHLPGKSSGRKSWLLWADQLKDAELAGHHYYSGNVAGHLRRHRQCAAEYLKRMSERRPRPAADLLQQAAQVYGEVFELLRQMNTGKDDWDANRLQIVDLIQACMPLEAKAQNLMEQAAGMM
ncbi:MAG: hypothetical protein WC869_15435 [Phycisphaerae bacterium]|jgi:hypothetical protein